MQLRDALGNWFFEHAEDPLADTTLLNLASSLQTPLDVVVSLWGASDHGDSDYSSSVQIQLFDSASLSLVLMRAILLT